MKRYLFPIVGILAISLLVVFWYFEKGTDNQSATATPNLERQTACEQFLTIALFPDDNAKNEFMEKCLRGEPVLPGDIGDSNSETETVVAPPLVEIPVPAQVGAGCAIGGCSQQICGEAGQVEDVATTCEWRDEYACYSESRCEKQADGQCGWTETAGFKQCLATVAISADENLEVFNNQ